MNPGAQMGTALLAFGGLSLTVTILGVLRRGKTGGFGQVMPPNEAFAGQIVAMADEEYDLVLRAGAWVNGFHVTKPLASLLVGSGQAELRVYALAPIQIARAEVTGLHQVHGLFSSGLKFRTESGRLDKVTVWTGRKAREKLGELGWR